MKEHFCPAEQSTITYQDKCNWCGEQEALAQTQEPVAWWNDMGGVIDLNVSGRGKPLYTTPPQRTEQKMVAWPCLIDTADFSKGTVTIVMQCDNYKVSAGTHWLSPTPPQRTWVGLSDEQIDTIGDKVANEKLFGAVPNFRVRFAKAIEAKLKELNT